jgi:hypothetical protein
MVFEHIENLKQQYTDKYVVVDESLPELARFRGLTGTVKTVNMSGRALVQFDGHNNIGWYDIDLDFLKIIDQPLPKMEKPAARKEKPAAKAVEKKPLAAKAAPGTKAAAPAAGKQSVADILAAARSADSSAKAKPSATAAKPEPAAQSAKAAQAGSQKMSVSDILAAARAEKGSAKAAPQSKPAPATAQKSSTPVPKEPTASPAGKSTGRVDPQKMSVADILAAARSEKKGVPRQAVAAEESITQPVTADTGPAAEPDETAKSSDVQSSVATNKPAAGKLPTSTADIVAYCRQRDAK